ncbi:hypothetical protein [Pseudogulbenkiania ferrooxidans]|uniref:Uncharacterized protein n=1 Tax=Pseudogulbenkiania ferrooxidans 2002 TaxID=279714 RepID=B9YYW4_9NEIS|nr:hypothetical protein [Pseudogulbenkiania ferrooxidans]EEG10317.1 hypothetical protein FuraDRAFT_0299 [Pseudogulbenkiania ferrooxidans 2002]
MKRNGLSGLDACDLVGHSVACVEKMRVLVKCMRGADAADIPVLIDLVHDQAESYGQIFEGYQQKVA